MFNNNKGISPLVATVMLIATSVSLALIINVWVVNYVNERLKEIEVSYTSSMECIKSSFRLLTYLIEEGKFKAVIENTGSYPLYDFKIIYYTRSNIVSSFLNISLNVNEIKYFEHDLLFEPEHIRIIAKTENCKLVYVDVIK